MCDEGRFTYKEVNENRLRHPQIKRNGKLEIVRMLVEHGADVRMRTDGGKNALNFAQERGHQEVADFLLGVGLT